MDKYLTIDIKRDIERASDNLARILCSGEEVNLKLKGNILIINGIYLSIDRGYR